MNNFWRHQDQLQSDTKTALHSAIFQMNGPIKKKNWVPHRYLRIDTSFLVSRQAEQELMLLHWENHTHKSRDFIFANPYLFQWEVQLLFLIEFDIEPCLRLLFAFEPLVVLNCTLTTCGLQEFATTQHLSIELR